jgi:hypothetical protein
MAKHGPRIRPFLCGRGADCKKWAERMASRTSSEWWALGGLWGVYRAVGPVQYSSNPVEFKTVQQPDLTGQLLNLRPEVQRLFDYRNGAHD